MGPFARFAHYFLDLGGDFLSIGCLFAVFFFLSDYRVSFLLD